MCIRDSDRQCTHSLHRNDMVYCHFELCRDCGLGCFSESMLANIRRLSVPGGAGGVLVSNNCFLPARRYASAGYSDCNVSVRPSVTRRYCVKTKKARGMISSPSDSPNTLVF